MRRNSSYLIYYIYSYNEIFLSIFPINEESHLIGFLLYFRRGIQEYADYHESPALDDRARSSYEYHHAADRGEEMETMPIIRLEIEHMQQEMLYALTRHKIALDSSVQAAIEAYCTPENLDAVVRTAAKNALDAAVKEEVRDFFQSSNPGRRAVREAVIEYLNANLPVDPMAGG